MIYESRKIPFLSAKAMKAVGAELRTIVKASGWKSSRGVLFQQAEDWFIAAHLRSYKVGHGFGLRVELMAKPMLIDPLYWVDAESEALIDEPLSFRYWGGIVCSSPVIAARPIHAESNVDMAQNILSTANALLPEAQDRLKDEDFVDIVSASIPNNVLLNQTLIYARKLAENPEHAAVLAREMKANPKLRQAGGVHMIRVIAPTGNSPASSSTFNKISRRIPD